MADRLHPGLVLVHPDPRLRAEIVAALTDRGYTVAVADRQHSRHHAGGPRPREDPPRVPGLAPDTSPHVHLAGAGRNPKPVGLESDVPAACVVIADHTQVPLDIPGQLLVLVPTHEQGAILAAFAAGADDVLAGPLRPAELVTRVALLARTGADSGRLTVGPITVDTLARIVTVDGQPLDLTRTEYELLARLAAAPGRVFTKQELLHAISRDQRARPANPRSTRPHRRVDTQAARLRRRLGEHRGLLVTVWGVGYRLG